MPLRGDLVPSRFYPLGVERAQPVVGGLYRPLGVCEVEFGLPVCGLSGGKFFLGLAQRGMSFPTTGGRWTGIVIQSPT